MYNVKISDKTFNIEFDKNKLEGKIDDEKFILDIIKTANNRYHLLKNNKSYNVDIIDVDLETKKVLLKINKETYEVDIKNDVDVLLENLGMSSVVSKVAKDIKAPMPGMLTDILVKSGDIIKQGDILLVLEAMKMENNIKSPVDAVIKSIEAKKGTSVEKNEILILFE